MYQYVAPALHEKPSETNAGLMYPLPPVAPTTGVTEIAVPFWSSESQYIEPAYVGPASGTKVSAKPSLNVESESVTCISNEWM